MSQFSSQGVATLRAVPKGSGPESDYNARLAAILEQMQQQIADLQSQVAALTGFSGSATFGTAHTMTVSKGLVTGYS